MLLNIDHSANTHDESEKEDGDLSQDFNYVDLIGIGKMIIVGKFNSNSSLFGKKPNYQIKKI
jgi:hypothetical protein